MKLVAIMNNTREIIATGEGYIACSDAAKETGVWDQAPGTSAPYFITTEDGAKYFGAKEKASNAKDN